MSKRESERDDVKVGHKFVIDASNSDNYERAETGLDRARTSVSEEGRGKERVRQADRQENIGETLLP